MRLLAIASLLALTGCVSGLADPCETDKDCASGYCLATRAPKDGDAPAVDVKFCVKPCQKDEECLEVSNEAKCGAKNLQERKFCAEPM